MSSVRKAVSRSCSLLLLQRGSASSEPSPPSFPSPPPARRAPPGLIVTVGQGWFLSPAARLVPGGKRAPSEDVDHLGVELVRV